MTKEQEQNADAATSSTTKAPAPASAAESSQANVIALPSIDDCDVEYVEFRTFLETTYAKEINQEAEEDEPEAESEPVCPSSATATDNNAPADEGSAERPKAVMAWGSANPYVCAVDPTQTKDALPEGQQRASTSAVSNLPTELCLEDDYLGGSVCVFYTNSPFSDFAPFPFIVDGRYYYTLEHYFQVQMLYAFGLFKLASECLRIPDAVEFRSTLKKGLRELVKQGTFEETTFTKWKASNTFRVLRRGNKAKFEQNYQLKQILMHTEERLLIFANSKDRLLGVGMTEAEFLVWAQKNEVSLEDLIEIWTGRVRRPRDLGQNVLALTLMEVRAEMLRKPSVITEWKHTHKDLGLPPLIKRFEALETEDKEKVQALQTLIAENARNPECLRPLPVRAKTSGGKQQQDKPMIVDPTDTAFAMGRWFDEQPYHKDKADDARRKRRSRSSSRSPPPDKDSGKVLAEDRSTIDTTDYQTQVPQPQPAEPEPTDDAPAPPSSSQPPPGERTKNCGAPKPKSWKTAAIGAEKEYHPDSVIGRLMKLTKSTTMINPFTIAENETQMPDDNETDEARAEREHLEQQRANEMALSVRQPIYRRPPGTSYYLEPGEICPPGVVAPPEGVDAPAVLLPMPMRPGTEFITAVQPTDYDANPAALPPELLPLPQMPADFEGHPYHWRDRFPGAPRRMPLADCPLHVDKYPMWAGRPRLIEAPSEDPDCRRKVWEPTKNPVAAALRQAKAYMDQVRRMLLLKRQPESDEGATPTQLRARKRRYSDSELTDAPAPATSDAAAATTDNSGALPQFSSEDRLLAAYLAKRMRAHQQCDWLNVALPKGAKLPPIKGDPRAQMRNKKIPEQRGSVRFVNREAALRHAANRWCRQGKLGSTGKYLDLPDEADEESDDEPVDFSLRLEDPDDGKLYPPKPKQPVQTHIIYVDTSRYEHYVRWYQRLHGFVPLPETQEYMHHERLRGFYQSYRANMDMLMCEPTDAELYFGENEAMKGVEHVVSHRAWGEHWAMSRLQWADWERRVDRGEHARMIDLTQKAEVKDEGASVTARPLKYELVDLTDEVNDQEVLVDADVAAGVADLVFAKLEPITTHELL